MARLKHFQIDGLREWFCGSPGYILDFSNKTFDEFFDDHFEVNILSDAFSDRGTSKFNRLLAFLEVSPPHLVVETLHRLWERRNRERDDRIKVLSQQLNSDAFSVSVEHVDALEQQAALEDVTFEKLVAEISKQLSHSIVPHFEKIASEWTLDTLETEFKRAFDNLESDPEASVTAACSMLESLFRSILSVRQLPFPSSLDVKALYKSVREPLGLDASKDLPPSETEADIRSILSAISNFVSGIGALRTHAGTAHGRQKGIRRIDSRIARLAVHSSCTVAVFILETWERRYPSDKLIVAASP